MFSSPSCGWVSTEHDSHGRAAAGGRGADRREATIVASQRAISGTCGSGAKRTWIRTADGSYISKELPRLENVPQ